jgi:hypothetical protein
MIQWHIEKRLVKDLKDHPNNPRHLSKDQEKQLITSLKKFGLIDKPCINLDNQLIGGHQRTKILKKLGYKEIDVLVPDRLLTDDEVNELCLRLNKNSGSWDYEVLTDSFDTDTLFDVGFSVHDFVDYIDDTEKPEKKKKAKTCPHCGVEL